MRAGLGSEGDVEGWVGWTHSAGKSFRALFPGRNMDSARGER